MLALPSSTAPESECTESRAGADGTMRSGRDCIKQDDAGKERMQLGIKENDRNSPLTLMLKKQHA